MKIKQIVCWFRGHVWDYFFYETVCKRCGKVKKDRLYPTGLGKEPKDLQ